MNILVVDDQRSARRILCEILGRAGGVNVFEASTLLEARHQLKEVAVDLALVDLRLDGDPRNRDGLTLVQEIRNQTSAFAIVVTVSNEMSEIRAAMRMGAYDYILKDDLCEELVLPLVEGLRTRQRLEHEVETLRARAAPHFLDGLVGVSPAMEQLRATIRRVALSDRPVLVTGPTGAGKELVVRAIHSMGAHPEQPLLDLNCGAIPEQLIESQLFGHEKGAFTGADKRQEGYLQAVREGTLFLDEVAELPLALQAKLLRVLEARRFRPIGTTVERELRGRVVAATHANLEERVKLGQFREDLFYRLGVLVVRVPALDDRREDIPALVAHFAAQQHRKLRFGGDALDRMMASEWPGNVRQLRNFIDRIAVFADEELISAEVLERIGLSRAAAPSSDVVATLAREILKLPTADKLAAAEQALVDEAMALAAGNKSAAARLLGVHRKVIERRLDRFSDE